MQSGYTNYYKVTPAVLHEYFNFRFLRFDVPLLMIHTVFCLSCASSTGQERTGALLQQSEQTIFRFFKNQHMFESIFSICKKAIVLTWNKCCAAAAIFPQGSSMNSFIGLIVMTQIPCKAMDWATGRHSNSATSCLCESVVGSRTGLQLRILCHVEFTLITSRKFKFL